jgi:peptidoglycan/LPS O-acetylase OafA/YrhL
LDATPSRFEGPSGGAPGAQARRADIQGLRAVAVLAVIAYHARETVLPGGFVGVDVFFVVSGFLITGVLIRPMDRGAFSLVEFYQRRVRRILPALFLVVFATLFAGLAVFPPALLVTLLESQLFTTLFTSNFYFLDKTDYFDLQAELMPLLHTWSLAVEEQFYIIYPLLLFALHRFARRYLAAALGAFLIASLAFSEFLLPARAEEAFYSPLSRAFELLIGAACAATGLRAALPRAAVDALSLAALAGLGASFALISGERPFPGVLALLPCVSTAILLMAPQAAGARLLSWRPLAAIGDMSYSLYLWHWPLLVFAKFLYPDEPAASALAVALAFGASALSYRFVEKPFLGPRPLPALRLGAAAMAAATLAGLPVYLADGLPQRFPPRARAFIAASEDYNQDRKRCHMRSDRPIAYAQTCVYGDVAATPSVAVWGDSHGAELAPVLGARLAARGASLRSITMSGCAPTLSRDAVCTRHNRDTMAAIIADPAMRTIVLTANLHGRDEFAQDSLAGVKETAQELARAGREVVIVRPIPTYDFDPPSMLALAARAGRDPAAVGMARTRFEARSGWIEAELARFARAHGVKTVTPSDLYCDAERCRVFDAEIGALYYNYNHLSLTGAGPLADAILKAIDEGAKAPAAEGARTR